MTIAISALATSVALLGFVCTADAQTAGGHAAVQPQDIKWAPAPPSLPPGAQIAVLYGDPGKEEMFAFRIKFPRGYRIAPHTHPKPEVITVISGTFRLGMGDTGDQNKAERLAAGSFVAITPGMVHYASADEETVVQLNSTGPWAINYVNPKDDPRNK